MTILELTYCGWLLLFQAIVTMNDDVQINSLRLNKESYCNSNSSNINLEFFSTKGVVRLELLNIPFNNLSYAVATNVTGIDLHHLLRM